MYRFTLKNNRLGQLPLKTPPVGWKDMAFEFGRDKRYHGITATVSFDAEFVREGRDFIKAAYDREGIEAKVEILIEQYNTETFEYETAYPGLLKFTNYTEEADKVICNVEQTGYARQFLNLDDVEINLQKLETLNGQVIPPFAEELKVIQLHSKEIVQKYEAFSSGMPPMPVPTWATDPGQRSPTISFGFDNVLANELDATTYLNSFDFEDSIPVVLTSKVRGPFQVQLRIHGPLKVELNNGNFEDVEVKYWLRKNNETPFLLASHAENNISGDFYEEIDTGIKTYNFNLEIGDRIYLWGDIHVFNVSGSYRFTYSLWLFDNSFLKITGNTQTNPTFARGLMAHEAFSRIVQSTSDLQAEFRSDFFGRTDSQPVACATDGPGSLLWVSNGFQIRNFPITEKPIFSSFRKIFESMDALYNLGVGIEYENGKEVLRVEPKRYFYKNEVVLQLGCVSDVKKTVAIDYFYNQAEFGYQQWQTEQANGLEEFNAKQTVTLPLTQVKSKYTALSPYIASGYTLEMTRREQYVNTETKDGRQDNQNFMVCLLRNGSGFETERNQLLPVLDNVISPGTVYNARISPARNKRRHGSMLSAGLQKQLSKQVKFQNGEGNYTMRSRFVGETATVVENEDLQVADLEEPLWLPEYYEFTAPFSYAQQQLFAANPYGQVEFEDEEGNVGRGYVVSLKTKPTEEKGEFKLLRAYNG